MSTCWVYQNIGFLVSLNPAFQKKGIHIQEKDLGIIKNAAMVVYKGRIVYVGSFKKLDVKKIISALSLKKTNIQEVDLQHQTVLPGWIESHTHACHLGHRAFEFEWRNRGVSYQEISARGGGILSTVRSVRSSSDNLLLQTTQEKVNNFLHQGVTTLEIKSGYGLDLKSEIKMLQVIDKIQGPRVVSTFLGAHALEQKWKAHPSEYLRYLVDTVWPEVLMKTKARRVDIFIEKGFFSKEDAEFYFNEIQKKYLQFCQQKKNQQKLGLVVHADQLSLSGGADLACRFKALSADHVIQVGPSQIQKMAAHEVTALLLPAADFYMRLPYPPARKLIEAGVRVALATDFNPGTSPTQDLNFVGMLARLEMKMTLPEVISAYTVAASYALNCAEFEGSLSVGKYANFLSISGEWNELFYSVGSRAKIDVYIRGKKQVF